MLSKPPDLRSENSERTLSRPEALPNRPSSPTPTSNPNNITDRLVTGQYPAPIPLSIPFCDDDCRLLPGKPRDHLVHDHAPTHLLPRRNNTRLPPERQPISDLTSCDHFKQSSDHHDDPLQHSNINNNTTAAGTETFRHTPPVYHHPNVTNTCLPSATALPFNVNNNNQRTTNPFSSTNVEIVRMTKTIQQLPSELSLLSKPTRVVPSLALALAQTISCPLPLSFDLLETITADLRPTIPFANPTHTSDFRNEMSNINPTVLPPTYDEQAIRAMIKNYNPTSNIHPDLTTRRAQTAHLSRLIRITNSKAEHGGKCVRAKQRILKGAYISIYTGAIRRTYTGTHCMILREESEDGPELYVD